MELEYQRTMDRSYLILRGGEIYSDYEEEMLKRNRISSLLRFVTVSKDNELQYWYDITGCRSLMDYLSSKRLSVQILAEIIICLAAAFDEINRFLLNRSSLFLSSDTIFIREENSHIRTKLCYCPGIMSDFNQDMILVMNFLLENTDHSDNEVTKLCYELYKIVSTGEFTGDDLADAVQPYCGKAENKEDSKVEVKEEIEFHAAEETETNAGSLSIAKGPDEGNDDENDITFSDSPVEYIKDILKRILSKIKDKSKKRLQTWKRKSIGERPKKEDYIYDPADDYDEPTVLLSRTENTRREPVSYVLKYQGDGGESDFVISKDSYRIGSKEGENDGVLKSKGVSRHHARIVKTDDGVMLEDLNSKNGTFLNGKIVNYKKPEKLSADDVIIFANEEYRLLVH